MPSWIIPRIGSPSSERSAFVRPRLADCHRLAGVEAFVVEEALELAQRVGDLDRSPFPFQLRRLVRFGDFHKDVAFVGEGVLGGEGDVDVVAEAAVRPEVAGEGGAELLDLGLVSNNTTPESNG